MSHNQTPKRLQHSTARRVAPFQVPLGSLQQEVHMHRSTTLLALVFTATAVMTGGCLSNPQTASDEEAEGLLFMREEEKLARDVYGVLVSDRSIFANIQTSEQRHFDAVGALLDTYGLTDPAAGMVDGAFQNAELQALYHQLVEQGAVSEEAALTVGCAIEELDLRDLASALEAVDDGHDDIIGVYERLALGSRNHLRSFYGALTADGGAYVPTSIDQASFDAIVNAPREQGRP
jgi:hypothetical protein